MAQDTTLPPELQAEIKQVEAEANALEAQLAKEVAEGTQRLREYTMAGGTIPNVPYGSLHTTGCAPLPYVRELLAMLKDAWVEDYQDGPLRIHRDIEGMRAHVQATQAPPERVW